MKSWQAWVPATGAAAEAVFLALEAAGPARPVWLAVDAALMLLFAAWAARRFHQAAQARVTVEKAPEWQGQNGKGADHALLRGQRADLCIKDEAVEWHDGPSGEIVTGRIDRLPNMTFEFEGTLTPEQAEIFKRALNGTPGRDAARRRRRQAEREAEQKLTDAVRRAAATVTPWEGFLAALDEKGRTVGAARGRVSIPDPPGTPCPDGVESFRVVRGADGRPRRLDDPGCPPGCQFCDRDAGLTVHPDGCPPGCDSPFCACPGNE